MREEFCMLKKLRSILGGGGFYAVLALCVLAVGIGGYFLLTDSPAQPETPETETSQTEAPQAAVSAPVEDVPAEPPAVETTAPAEPEAAGESVQEAEPVDDTPVVAAVPKLVVEPLEGKVLTAFSVDQLVYSQTLGDWRTHDGVDISAEEGTDVLAASGGTVRSVSDDPLMGTTVVLDHGDGYQTTYASLQVGAAVEVGDSVTAGQVIGTVGTTAAAESAQGPHLHFSVTHDGDAVDPEEYLNK